MGLGYIPDLRSLSSNTLNAVNFLGSTPCIPRICIDVLEKPHWGVSGVPFMNRTTGAEATALSMAVRTSCDSSLVCSSDCDTLGRRELWVVDGEREDSAPRTAGNRMDLRSIVERLLFSRCVSWYYRQEFTVP